MKHLFTRATMLLLVLLVLSVAVVEAGSTYTTSTGRYKLGGPVIFKVQDSGSNWWSCCCCQCNTCNPSQVLGWHIEDSSGQIIYSVVHDAPVLSASWQGTWAQVDSSGAAVSAGNYILYVDTSVGTLSRFVTLYDPCNYCTWGWGWCCNTCQEKPTIVTDCYCKASLVLLKQTTTCCWPFQWPCGNCNCP